MIVPGYDAAGRLSTLTNPRGTTSLGYDTAGRVWTVTAPDLGMLTYAYDGFLQTGESWSGTVSGAVGWTYDNDFRVSSTSVNGSAVSYQYDADSLLTGAGALSIGREAGTGRISGTTLGSVATSQGYNEYGELVSFSAGSAYSYSLSRDLAGRIVGKTETVQGATDSYAYGYDAGGRLATVTKNGLQTASYVYDQNGNRLSKSAAAGTETGSYDDQDRMYAYGAAAYAYRPNGELATKTVGGQTTLYDYDAFGNLRGVQLPNGTVIEYIVDGQNRRIGKKVNGVLVEDFLYEGQLRPVAWLDGTGAVKARFVYGTRVNVPEYMVVGASTYRILTDHLGSPRLVIDTSSGAVAQRIDYDEWGVVTYDSAPGFQPFGFAGGLYDRDTGLVRFGQRDYDPSMGRWRNKDPIGFNGRDANLYVYVANDPLNWIDPDGLDWTDWDLQPWADFFAGFGDTLTSVPFTDTSLTGFIRSLNGSESVVNKCSGAYSAGKWTGVGYQIAMAGAASGPKGPLFGRARYRGGSPGIFNRGDTLRVGWSWDASAGRNMFGAHGGVPGTPGHWHFTPIPGPTGPLW